MAKIKVLDANITVVKTNDEDYITLADIAKSKDGEQRGEVFEKDKDKMHITPYRIDCNGRVKTKKRKFKNRKPKNFKAKPMHFWAVDSLESNRKNLLITMKVYFYIYFDINI